MMLRIFSVILFMPIVVIPWDQAAAEGQMGLGAYTLSDADGSTVQTTLPPRSDGAYDDELEDLYFQAFDDCHAAASQFPESYWLIFSLCMESYLNGSRP